MCKIHIYRTTRAYIFYIMYNILFPKESRKSGIFLFIKSEEKEKYIAYTYIYTVKKF